MKVAKHPTLNILVREDGCVYLQSRNHPARWTFGSKNSKGYLRVCINNKDFLVHRLVAQTFLGQIPSGMEVDHINRCPSDNRVENLRIVTSHENHINTSYHDRVEARGGTHWYEDADKARREQHARYKAEHLEKVREYQAHYRAENKDKVRRYAVRYRAENKDKKLAYEAHYRATNKEKVCEWHNNWRQTKRKTHRLVHFADGRQRWILHEEAEALLAIPLSKRILKE